MGVLTTVREILQASTQSANRGSNEKREWEGAYWCHPCSERMLDVDVEGEVPPNCPSCGDEMEFDRSASSTGCAC